MQYMGAVLQHLVGAKLDCALGIGAFAHNSFSTSDSQTGRAGDFFIEDVAIHVTTAPGEAVIERCKANISEGHKPVIVTLQRGLTVADRIDVFEAEQFIALNLYEIGRFGATGRRVAVQDIIKRYNAIVDEFETDPSLKIDFR